MLKRGEDSRQGTSTTNLLGTFTTASISKMGSGEPRQRHAQYAAYVQRTLVGFGLSNFVGGRHGMKSVSCASSFYEV